MSAPHQTPPGATMPTQLRERLRALGRSDDVDLGVRLLRGTPTNEAREHAALTQVSRAALRFGHDLAADPDHAATGFTARIRERSDGLESAAPAVARFLPRQGRIELFTDVIAHCEAVVDALGWRSLFPPGSIREAALHHERAHALISHEHARGLRRAVGVPALRLGRFVRWAHVAGADELAAHGYAQFRLGLPRSPLLVTVAAMATLDDAPSAATPLKED